VSERILGSNLCDKGSPFHTEGPTTENALLLFIKTLVILEGGVVGLLECQSRGRGFKSWPGQKFGSRFLLYLCP